ncbi:Com family DNA-binding transcriptional regulator [Clostridium sp. N37]|uniref:Com family DNA-binding transcriptional regulator n=2 Tax=Clostridium faecium TaxID=2762223 RepID=A0ABR8YS43_9CLOT|nr:Com family DNA-binding transcriptional regulator [Clostridium faecium]
MMEKSNKEKPIRCPHCNQRLLDAEYVIGTIKCPRCRNIIKLNEIPIRSNLEKLNHRFRFSVNKVG